MRRLRTLLVATSLALGLYILWWHVVLLAALWPLDPELYVTYVRNFLFGPGLEIPTFVQLVGAILAALCLLVIGGFQLVRLRRAGARRSK